MYSREMKRRKALEVGKRDIGKKEGKSTHKRKGKKEWVDTVRE